MKKAKKPTDDECISRLQATAKSLADEGASTWDIVTAFIDVAINLAERDPAYAQIEIERLAETFGLGESLARAKLEKIAPPKKQRKRT